MPGVTQSSSRQGYEFMQLLSLKCRILKEGSKDDHCIWDVLVEKNRKQRCEALYRRCSSEKALEAAKVAWSSGRRVYISEGAKVPPAALGQDAHVEFSSNS